VNRLVRRYGLQHFGLFLGLSTVGILATAIQPAWANDDQAVIATTIEEWLTQIAQSNVVEVTGIRLMNTATGLEVIVETREGEVSQPSSSVVGNALILDIPNAVLVLPDGGEFQEASPADGIAFVSVTNLPDNGIRVAITGSDRPPAADIRATPQGLVLGVVPGGAGVEGTPEPDAIQVVVTGEQEPGGYTVREATVTRLDVPLRDIPRSIQVVPQQVIEDQNAIRLDEALRNVSGAARDSTFGGTADAFLLRGFMADIYRNGLPEVVFASTFSSLRETVNIERVEVLRGPASILFGSLSPGGVINLVTEQPLEEPFYEIDFSIGNYSLYRPSIDFSGPLTGDGLLLYRLNAVYENSSSFRDFTDIERVFVAPVVEWRISDRTNLTFELEYLNDERPFDRGLVAIGDTVADIPISRRLGEPSDVRRVEDLSVGYRLDHEINDDWTLRNSFRALFSDNYTRRFEPRSLDETTGILQREFRIVEGDRQGYSLRTEAAGNFATGSIQHRVLVGIDLSRVLTDETGFRVRPSEPINIFDPVYFRQIPDAPLSFASATRTNSLGLYVQDLVSFTDQLKFLVGGRFDLVDQNNRDPLSDSETYQGDTAFSPNVGIVYQPTEEISLYGSFSRSFQPNFALRADGSFLEPERGTQYEIGVRGIFLDERLIANLSLYRLTKTNVGITDPDNPDFSIPVGEQRSQGIELDVTGEILPGWNVIATYAYTDAVSTEGDDFAPEGNQFINVPRHSASLWTTYEVQSGNLQGLGAGIGLFFVDERPGDLENTFTLPSYLRTDAAIYYRRNNWRVALNFKNLFNVRYFESSIFGRERITPGAPFTIVGSVAVEF